MALTWRRRGKCVSRERVRRLDNLTRNEFTQATGGGRPAEVLQIYIETGGGGGEWSEDGEEEEKEEKEGGSEEVERDEQVCKIRI